VSNEKFEEESMEKEDYNGILYLYFYNSFYLLCLLLTNYLPVFFIYFIDILN